VLGVTPEQPPGSTRTAHPLQRQNERPPWLGNELLGVLKYTHKKVTCWLWKGDQTPIKNYKKLAGGMQSCSQKALAQLKLTVK